MSDDDEKPEIDLLAILDEFEPMREMMRGLVAVFVADGFTEEQARPLAVTVATGYRFNSAGGEAA
jgi:hypothetical protein